MGVQQRLRRHDVINLLASGLFGVALATILLLTTGAYARLSADVDAHLQHIAAAVNDRFTGEIERAAKQLEKMADTIAKDTCSGPPPGPGRLRVDPCQKIADPWSDPNKRVDFGYPDSAKAALAAVFAIEKGKQSTRSNPLRKADGSVMTLALLGGVTASATDTYFLDSYPDIQAAAQARETFSLHRARPQPVTLSGMAVYRARPLNGVAFTAPYGHNGAWPTLESVLFPDKRPESFWIGHSEFDPAAVGVDVVKGAAICGAPNAPPMCFKMTTTEHQPGHADSGNSRSGHAGARFYLGREPSERETRAILEYLKSI